MHCVCTTNGKKGFCVWYVGASATTVAFSLSHSLSPISIIFRHLLCAAAFKCLYIRCTKIKTSLHLMCVDYVCQWGRLKVIICGLRLNKCAFYLLFYIHIHTPTQYSRKYASYCCFFRGFSVPIPGPLFFTSFSISFFLFRFRVEQLFIVKRREEKTISSILNAKSHQPQMTLHTFENSTHSHTDTKALSIVLLPTYFITRSYIVVVVAAAVVVVTHPTHM